MLALSRKNLRFYGSLAAGYCDFNVLLSNGICVRHFFGTSVFKAQNGRLGVTCLTLCQMFSAFLLSNRYISVGDNI